MISSPTDHVSPTPAAPEADAFTALCGALLEALPVGVGLFAADGRLARANPTFRAMLATAGVRAPRSLADTLAPAGDALDMAMARVARGERAGPVCVAFGDEASARLVDATIIPFDAPEAGRLVAVVLAAVTGLDEAPRRSSAAAADPVARSAPARGFGPELDALLAEQARRAHERRLAAVGQLAAGVMHDVNNALNPIVAAAYLLERHADDAGAVRDYARRIARAAETGAATAARVGRFIRQEPSGEDAYRAVDLAMVAAEAVDITRPLWAGRAGGVVELAFECAPGLHVRGCAGELREALLNLVQNALDAMPGGGTLRLRTVALPDEYVLEVTDTGAGMSDEVRERAFEPFFTTKGAQGPGLGLAEVGGIVRRHRGRAALDTAPGAGTTVRIAFPRDDRDEHGDRARPPAARVAAPGTRRVLLVEDDADGREMMRRVLASDGHAVDAVANATTARARLARECPYDVLLTDLGLPDGGGWELVREVRGRWPTLRVGVITAWEPDAFRDVVPAHFAMRKPVRATELLALVATAADAGG